MAFQELYQNKYNFYELEPWRRKQSWYLLDLSPENIDPETILTGNKSWDNNRLLKKKSVTKNKPNKDKNSWFRDQMDMNEVETLYPLCVRVTLDGYSRCVTKQRVFDTCVCVSHRLSHEAIYR